MAGIFRDYDPSDPTSAALRCRYRAPILRMPVQGLQCSAERHAA
jgi:hypothetical protein